MELILETVFVTVGLLVMSIGAPTAIVVLTALPLVVAGILLRAGHLTMQWTLTSVAAWAGLGMASAMLFVVAFIASMVLQV